MKKFLFFTSYIIILPLLIGCFGLNTYAEPGKQHQKNVNRPPPQPPAPVFKPNRPVPVAPATVKPAAPISRGVYVQKNYHVHHGYKFEHGYYYKGWNHRHWTTYQWSPTYGTYIYYDPYVTAWYYWSEPDNCYYPVTYCPHKTYSFVSRRPGPHRHHH